MTKGTCGCPSARYAIVYQDGKRQKWSTVSRSKKEAEKKLAFVMAEIHQGIYKELKTDCFRNFSENWLSTVVEPNVKPRTFRSYRDILKLHLNPVFGDHYLQQINQEGIQKFLAQCIKENKLAPRTANYFIMLLKMILRYAMRIGYLRINPAEYIKKLKEEKMEPEFLRPDEFQKLLKHSYEPYKTLFAVAIATGVRQGELLALRWGDIDWHNNTIHVKRTLYWKENRSMEKEPWIFGPPKTPKSVRVIDMTPKLREILQIHRIKTYVNPHDLIFCTRNGAPMDAKSMVSQTFNPALDRADLRRVPFHALRHTNVSVRIANNEHIKYIQLQLGHASIQMTMDLYGHWLPRTDQKYENGRDDIVFGISCNEPLSSSLKM